MRELATSQGNGANMTVIKTGLDVANGFFGIGDSISASSIISITKRRPQLYSA